jgi:hypothetical protein
MIPVYRMMMVGVMVLAACSKPKEQPAADTQGGMAMDTSRMPGGAGMISMMPATWTR